MDVAVGDYHRSLFPGIAPADEQMFKWSSQALSYSSVLHEGVFMSFLTQFRIFAITTCVFAFGDLAVSQRNSAQAADDVPTVHGQPAAYWVEAIKADDQWLRVRAARALRALATDDPVTVEILAGALKDKRVRVRLAVAETLAGLGSRATPASALLTAALKDGEPGVRLLAAEALGGVGPLSKETIAELAKLITEEKDEGIKVAAVEAIASAADIDTAGPVLEIALKDADGFVRVKAAAALIRLGRDSLAADNALIGALSDKRPLVRREALEVLPAVTDPEPAIPAIFNGTKDEDAAVRTGAIRALGALGIRSPSAVVSLGKLLAGGKKDVRLTVCAALAALEGSAQPASDSLLKILKDDDVGVKLAVLEALGPLHLEASAADALIPLLSDPDPTVRSEVLPLLADLGADRVVGPVAKLLTDKVPAVKVRAALVLGRIGTAAKPIIGGLVDLLRKDQVAEVRRAAATALGEIVTDSAEAIAALGATLKDRDLETRRVVAEALAAIGPPAKDAVPGLVRALAESPPAVRSSIAIALGRIGAGAKDAVPTLVTLLRTGKDTAQLMPLLMAIGGIGPDAKDAVAPVAGLTRSRDATIRRSAAIVLGQIGIGSADAAAALIAAAKDRDASIREAALFALGEIGVDSPIALKALAAGLKDHEVDNRRLAARALGGFGAKATPVLPELKAALADPSGLVREAAREAIEQIAKAGPR